MKIDVIGFVLFTRPPVGPCAERFGEPTNVSENIFREFHDTLTGNYETK